MRSLLLAGGLLGLLSCHEIDSTPPPSSRTSLANTKPYSLDIHALTADVERWTSDGHVDAKERLEILRAYGWNTPSFFWFRGGGYFWTGNGWLPFKEIISTFPLESLPLERFLAHYCSPK